ncbi:hypothetical protein AMTR_s00157p00058620, partial [Amborella trichopoda]
ATALGLGQVEEDGVKDLPAAVAAAESLMDYKLDASSEVLCKAKEGGRKEIGTPNNNEVGDPSGIPLANQEPRRISLDTSFVKAPIKPRVVEEGERGSRSSNSPSASHNTKGGKRDPTNGGLMYVRITLNGKDMRAMADTGTTHNFVVDQEIARLGLKLGGDTSRMKTVNSASQLVVGTACDVLVNVGTWSRHIVLLVVALDGFDVNLGWSSWH